MKVVHILPNLRKGLSRNISSEVKDAEGLRAGFKVDIQMDGHKAGNNYISQNRLNRQFLLAGPVDVKSINAKAISQVVPADKSVGLSNGYMPYVEFLDEDLPWRYTPQPSSDKLVPWLLLLACKDGEFKVNQKQEGMKSVTITLDGTSGDELSTFYPDPSQFYKLAHVQINAPEGTDPLEYIKDNPDDGVSRLFCSRVLLPQTKYTMFLVPAFELGRLAGLKENFSDTVGIDKLSWEKGSTSNEFPIYYQWSFTSGAETFLKLARKQYFLTEDEVEGLSPGLKADISDTGLKMYRTSKQPVDDSEPIDIPVALVKKGFSESQLMEEDPQMRQELKNDLLLKSPVFSENADPGGIYEDPWVVPPVYGARHILADSKQLDNDSSFLKDLNLKFRNRVAAGMGANVIKRNQEMFVNRAWGVIEDINALNQRIREFYQVMKTNDASEEKITALRYYKFRPHAWGLQADAAIRVANAQSSASLNAVDLALDATDDSGRSLNVMTTSLGPFTRNGGISVQELRELTDPHLWAGTAAEIMAREEPFRYVSGQMDFFEKNPERDFLRDLLKVDHPQLSFAVENGTPKVNLIYGKGNHYFSFSRNSVIESGIIEQVLFNYPAAYHCGDILKWLDNRGLFNCELVEIHGSRFQREVETQQMNSLSGINDTLEDAKREFDLMWKGKSISDADWYRSKFTRHYSGGWFSLLPLIESNIALPIVFHCTWPSAGNKSPRPGSSVYARCDQGLIMNRSNYDKYFGEFNDDGVAIEFYLGSDKHYLYFFPFDRIHNLISNGANMYYHCRQTDGVGVNIELKFKDDSNYETFEPINNVQATTTICLGNVLCSYSFNYCLFGDKYDLLSAAHESWPSGLTGTLVMYVYQVSYKNNKNKDVWVDKGYRYFPLSLETKCWKDVKNSDVSKSLIYFLYKDGVLYLCRGDIEISLSLGGDLYSKNGNEVKVNMAAVKKLIGDAIVNLEWYDRHIWRPNSIFYAGPYCNNTTIVTADDIAGTNGAKLVEDLMSTYKKAMDQVDELHKIAMTDPDLKKALEGKIDNAISNIDPQATAPVIDADEINRKRLVELANEFAEKGITLDLKESNFDGKYPIMAAPIFPDPTSFYLRELSEKYILPSVEELKMNSISCFESNLAFEEAFLAGMNTEMGRELLWREYPTDERGSYFRKFWDQVEIPDDFGKRYFDIKYMHNWQNKLGENHEPGKGKMLVFIVRSELMVLYPQTTICLSQLKNKDGNSELACVLSPAMTGWLTNDTFMAGFYTNELKSNQGVYLTFVETDKSQRFSREYTQGAPDTLSSQFATNRADFGSVWGVEVEPALLKL